VSVSESLSLGFFSLIALILGFNSQAAALGPVSAFAVMAVTLPTVILGVWAFKRALQNLSMPTALAVLLSIVYGSSLGYGAGALTLFLGLPVTDRYTTQAALFVAINLTFTLGLGVAVAEREKSLRELEGAVEELALLTSRLRQQVWLTRKTLAMELHGSIQSTLQSVAAKLSRMTSPTDAELDEALAQVRDAFSRVDREDYLSGKSLRQLLDELLLLWDGALDVQIEVDEGCLDLLDQDQAAARCVLEVCREAVTNAVKHGFAEQVKISISLGEGFVQIRAVNDGIKLTEELSGQGINLYREVAHDYSLTNESEGVTLNLQLPLSVKEQP
jgi:signal transduction histidine kinase